MTIKPVIEIFCDGNDQIGYGHIRRSLTLASELKKEGMDVTVVGLSDKARLILPQLKKHQPPSNINVFDADFGIDDLLVNAKNQGKTTITLDWFGDVQPDVNIGVYPHGKLTAKRAVYVGFEYVLIREEIRSLTISESTTSNKNVLIVLGGGDLLDQGDRAATLLATCGFDVTLVQGPFAKSQKDIEAYKRLRAPPNFSELLEAADWVVTNGGGCLFEAIFLGKAAYVLPQTDSELRVASYFNQLGAVLGVGINGLRGFELQEISEVKRRTAGLIDGLGVERISSIIRKLV